MNPKPLLTRDRPPVALTDRLESGIMPLINLVFLLLMFFLVAGVISEDQLPALPGNTAAQGQEEPRVDFTVDEAGQLSQNGQVVELQRLSALLRQDKAAAAKKDAQWRIGAHQDLSMADLERVLAAFDRAGIIQVQLLTEPGS
jgi:biopolymer transport protein ExbD